MGRARHEKVAGAFRRGADEEGSFDFHKATLIQEIAHELHHAVSQQHIVLHARAAKIQIAILESQRFVVIAFFVDVERRRLALVENGDAARFNLDLAGGHLRIHRALGAIAHNALNGDHELVAQLVGDVVRVLVDLGIEHHLRDAKSIAQIDEDQSTEIATSVDPSLQGDRRFRLRCGERSAGDSANCIGCYINGKHFTLLNCRQ